MKGAAAIGALVVAAHVAGFAALAARTGGDELVVDHGRVPESLAARTEVSRDGIGLVRTRWTVRYRGGFVREVGATELTGPLQDPAQHPCSGRVIVGQRLLDQLAGTMAHEIDAELRGESIFAVGDYQRLDGLSVRWARLEAHADDSKLVGDAPHGYVRAIATVIFERVSVPLVVTLVPEIKANAMHFRIAARAELAFDNRVEQWLSDKLGGDKLATRLARRQIDDVLITTLAPPPPFELGDGQTLRFTYCDQPPELAEGAWAALPFAVAFERLGRAPQILPPKLGSGPRVTPRADTALAIDLDVDALNAVLFELWRTGYLDRRLAEVGLDRRFNGDPIVTEYLSIRISPLRLALPPVVTATASGLRLAAEARVAIADGAETTTGDLYGTVAFGFASSTDAPRLVGVDLGALELTCERGSALVPCYSDLVAALRDRGDEFHGALTSAFADLLGDIFVGRLANDQLPAELFVRSVTPMVTSSTLRLELDATISTP